MQKLGTAVIADCKNCKEFYDEDAGWAACTHPKMQHNAGSILNKGSEGSVGTIECADCPIFNERHSAFMKKLGTRAYFCPTLWVSENVILDNADTLSEDIIGLWQSCSIYMESSVLTSGSTTVLTFNTMDFLSEYEFAYTEGTEGSWLEWDLAFSALRSLIDGGSILTEDQFEAYLFEYTPTVCLTIPTELYECMARDSVIIPPSDRIAGDSYYA